MQLQLRTTLAGFRNLPTTEEPGLYCTDVYLPYSFAAGLLSILTSLALTIPRSAFIFCPEVITTSAWSDWRNARRLVESLNDQQVSQELTTVRIFSISPPATDVLIYLQPQQTKSPHRHGDAVPPSSGSNSKPEAKLISDRHNELEALHKVKLTNAQTFVFE
jgi:hypothetical protein